VRREPGGDRGLRVDADDLLAARGEELTGGEAGAREADDEVRPGRQGRPGQEIDFW
jgi:hypothetical protein